MSQIHKNNFTSAQPPPLFQLLSADVIPVNFGSFLKQQDLAYRLFVNSWEEPFITIVTDG